MDSARSLPRLVTGSELPSSMQEQNNPTRPLVACEGWPKSGRASHSCIRSTAVQHRSRARLWLESLRHPLLREIVCPPRGSGLLSQAQGEGRAVSAATLRFLYYVTCLVPVTAPTQLEWVSEGIDERGLHEVAKSGVAADKTCAYGARQKDRNYDNMERKWAPLSGVDSLAERQEPQQIKPLLLSYTDILC